MPRSKLEKYLDILETLVPQALTLEKIAYQTDIECRMLKRHLAFLIKNQLVEERAFNEGERGFAITERGLAVFKTLQAQKYFEKLKNILPVVEEASEVGSLLSRSSSSVKEDG